MKKFLLFLFVLLSFSIFADKMPPKISKIISLRRLN